MTCRTGNTSMHPLADIRDARDSRPVISADVRRPTHAIALPRVCVVTVTLVVLAVLASSVASGVTV